MSTNRATAAHTRIPPRGRDIAVLAAFVAVCFVVAAIGGYATSTSLATWYGGLSKPAFNPPDAVFGPVWTLLYLAIAVAGWRLWRSGGFDVDKRLLAAYAAQLALNLLWSLIFFGARRPGAALLDVTLLFACIAVTIVLARRFDPLAAWLLVPYAGWVGFASVLNAAVWYLNR